MLRGSSFRSGGSWLLQLFLSLSLSRASEKLQDRLERKKKKKKKKEWKEDTRVHTDATTLRWILMVAAASYRSRSQVQGSLNSRQDSCGFRDAFAKWIARGTIHSSLRSSFLVTESTGRCPPSGDLTPAGSFFPPFVFKSAAAEGNRPARIVFPLLTRKSRRRAISSPSASDADQIRSSGYFDDATCDDNGTFDMIQSRFAIPSGVSSIISRCTKDGGKPHLRLVQPKGKIPSFTLGNVARSTVLCIFYNVLFNITRARMRMSALFSSGHYTARYCAPCCESRKI